MSTLTKISLLFPPFFLAASLWLVWPEKIPSYDGKPVSSWFYDLCSGVHGVTSKASGFRAAYMEFTQIDSNAVPYLVKQLRNGKTGVTEKIVISLRNFPLTKPLVKDVVLPSSRRTYAAVALRLMGTNAVSAVPALNEACKHDIHAVQLNAVQALLAIKKD